MDPYTVIGVIILALEVLMGYGLRRRGTWPMVGLLAMFLSVEARKARERQKNKDKALKP